MAILKIRPRRSMAVAMPKPYLQTRMAAEFQKCFDDSDVTFVDGNVQSSLAAFVAGIQIGAGVSQQFHDGRFVSKSRVVDGSVAIFVL
jgi:hypothetical protein